ncbi:alkyl hydroperoxide reductase [Sulfurifustis variabilis]|uniref:Alkyl hydroperoxide reductase n=1 Tax=Sulfurifustis variabilis TaxID=1675686 RepID=A0A1B4VF19_9GAMM|nr:TlpA disulfide reductase family protein [Sulfurifustis variabilis]BAU49287.1 alkyl hydroperoxide reductase [Sulfurifustis variabilis]
MRTALAVLLALGLSSAAAQPQTMTPVPGRPNAPDFTLPDIDGKTRRLSSNRGKVVLVNFWATWCPPCRREMPSMQRAWDQLKNENFVIYAVDVGEDEETIFGFTFSTGVEITFPILLDKEGKVVKQWPVRGLPTTFLIDAEGRIAYSAVGGREWDDPALIAQIRRLMRHAPAAERVSSSPPPP